MSENFAAEAVKRELRRAGSKRLAMVPGPNGSELEFWVAGKQTFIVQTFANGDGVEVWKPVTSKNDLEDTIKAMKLWP